MAFQLTIQGNNDFFQQSGMGHALPPLANFGTHPQITPPAPSPPVSTPTAEVTSPQPSQSPSQEPNYPYYGNQQQVGSPTRVQFEQGKFNLIDYTFFLLSEFLL